MLRTRLLLTIALVLFIATSAGAQTLIPLPPDRPRVHPVPPPGAIFSIESQHVDVDVDRQVAITTITQVFRNDTGRDQEGLYLFPIPADASVSRFTMLMNGDAVEGEVVEAARARRIYEDIVRRMRDPGLLEFVGHGLFRARVYPIPARGDVKIKLTYERVLDYDAGAICYRLPMRSTLACAGPRRGQSRVGELSVGVKIASDLPIRSVYSPTHAIDTGLRGKRATCGFEERDAVPTDFVLYYTVSEADVGLNLITHRRGGDDGYFMMLLSPGRVDDTSRILAKDVVFVLDTSGSMKGEKIDQAKAALAYCLERLRGDDRFNVVTFATAVHAFERGLVQASAGNCRRARRFVEALQARGGTDIDSALDHALDLPKSTRPRMVVFLTDGLPTVGEKNIRTILSNLEERNVTGARIFPFGVGYDVNTVLLDQMSEDHRGSVDYIRPEEDIEDRVSRFYNKVESPVLSDITLDLGGLPVSDVYPRNLPDMFDGSQLVVVGRYGGHGHKAITLSGHIGDETKAFDYEGRFARRERDNAFIPRLWATRKIAYLLSEIKRNGKDPELVNEVIELSLEHGIITPYTSFLILEEGSEDDRRRLGRVAPEERLQQFAEEPMADRMASLTVSKREAKKADSPRSSGAAATEVSREINRDKSSTLVSEADGAVRTVDSRRFVLKDGEWVESSVTDEMEVVEVEFLGERYFELLTKHPDLNKILALGERVTFVLDGRAYRVAP
jgi:Ca-activated chloride channel family protein